MATLELTPGVVFDPADFARFLADQDDLGTKWGPRFIRIAARIPLTGTTKVDKRPLRSAAWLTSDPVWWRPFVGRGASDDGSYRSFSPADADDLARQLAAHGRTALLAGLNPVHGPGR